MNTEGTFNGRKVVGDAADHSSTASVEMKNAWSYIFTPPIHLHDEVKWSV